MEAKNDWLADKKMSAGQSAAFVFMIYQSSVYGINATSVSYTHLTLPTIEP